MPLFVVSMFFSNKFRSFQSDPKCFLVHWFFSQRSLLNLLLNNMDKIKISVAQNNNSDYNKNNSNTTIWRKISRKFQSYRVWYSFLFLSCLEFLDYSSGNQNACFGIFWMLNFFLLLCYRNDMAHNRSPSPFVWIMDIGVLLLLSIMSHLHPFSGQFEHLVVG